MNLSFELTDHSASGPVTGLSRGHATLEGELGIVTSAGRTPDQSFLVFLGIVELLDGLSTLLSGPPTREWEWVGNDSSFRVTFARRKGHVDVEAMGEPVGRATDQELARAVWGAAKAFRDAHRLPPSDIAADDVASSLEEFHDRFPAWLG